MTKPDENKSTIIDLMAELTVALDKKEEGYRQRRLLDQEIEKFQKIIDDRRKQIGKMVDEGARRGAGRRGVVARAEHEARQRA